MTTHLRSYKIEGLDTVNPCPKCHGYSVYVATNINGLWFIKCPDCGLTTENHTNYEDAQLAWVAADTKPSFSCALAAILILATVILVILNLVLKGLTS